MSARGHSRRFLRVHTTSGYPPKLTVNADFGEPVGRNKPPGPAFGRTRWLIAPVAGPRDVPATRFNNIGSYTIGHAYNLTRSAGSLATSKFPLNLKERRYRWASDIYAMGHNRTFSPRVKAPTHLRAQLMSSCATRNRPQRNGQSPAY